MNRFSQFLYERSFIRSPETLLCRFLKSPSQEARLKPLGGLGKAQGTPLKSSCHNAISDLFDSIMNRAVESFQKISFSPNSDVPSDALSCQIDEYWQPECFIDCGEDLDFERIARESAEIMTRWFQENPATRSFPL